MSGAWILTERLLVRVARMPIFVIVSLIQPFFWLILFGSLFSGLAALPQFGGQSYLRYLAPGVAIMSAVLTIVPSIARNS